MTNRTWKKICNISEFIWSAVFVKMALEGYLEPRQTSKMELFVKIVKS